jgi:putative ABC transport system substrate-binding protein
MRRREFTTLLGGAAAAWPLAARAQQPDRTARIAWMDSFREDDANAQARVKAFQQVMEKSGWKVGSNLAIKYRWDLFDVEWARRAGAELLNSAPDLILCGGTPSALAMQQATRALPIVFVFVTDPIGQGLVSNLAHPGGNITGFSYFEPAVGAKWLGLLKETAPAVAHVSVMFNPVSSPYSPLYYQSIVAAAPRSSVSTATELVREPVDIERAMERLGREPGSGIILSADAFLYTNSRLVIELAARHRLPRNLRFTRDSRRWRFALLLRRYRRFVRQGSCVCRPGPARRKDR